MNSGNQGQSNSTPINFVLKTTISFVKTVMLFIKWRINKVYRILPVLVINFLLSIRFPPLILFEQDRLRFCNSAPVYKTRNMSNKHFFINIFDITVLGSIELISCKHLERILFTSTFQNFNVDQHRVDIISSSCAFFLV